MVTALERCAAALKCGCITNNVASGLGPGMTPDAGSTDAAGASLLGGAWAGVLAQLPREPEAHAARLRPLGLDVRDPDHAGVVGGVLVLALAAAQRRQAGEGDGRGDGAGDGEARGGRRGAHVPDCATATVAAAVAVVWSAV